MHSKLRSPLAAEGLSKQKEDSHFSLIENSIQGSIKATGFCLSLLPEAGGLNESLGQLTVLFVHDLGVLLVCFDPGFRNDPTSNWCGYYLWKSLG